MANMTRLGRGLDVLLSRSGSDVSAEVLAIPIASIQPNPRQPRQLIDPDDPEEKELEISIQEHGLLQPVLVRPLGDGRYELIAGERRFRASQRLGRTTVPALVRDADDESLLRLALVENIHRKDLNPIEKGEAIKQLIEDFDLTQDEAAKRLGKDRSTIANILRLLDLEPEIRDAVSRGTITMGHARALLGVEDAKERVTLFRQIQASGMNVRRVEAEVKKRSKRAAPKRPAANIEDLQDRMRERFGTKVTIQERGRGGRVVVHFGSRAEFDRLLELWGISAE